MRVYKIWVHVEAIDEERGEFVDLVDEGLLDPVSLGSHPRLEAAWRHILDLPGYAPHPSDEAVLGRTESIETEIWNKAEPAVMNGTVEEAMSGCGAPSLPDAKRYIRQGGVACPFCKSEQLEGGPFDCNTGQAFQEMLCLECGRDWLDVYRLSAIRVSDETEGKEAGRHG
jgi:hypothetical protein